MARPRPKNYSDSDALFEKYRGRFLHKPGIPVTSATEGNPEPQVAREMSKRFSASCHTFL